MDFTNKTVLITGASQGIGRATAIGFAQAGARVALHYNQNQAKVEETKAALAGSDHIIVQANLSDPLAIEQVVNKIIQEFNHIDILVNNAATNTAHPLDNSSYQQWQTAWQQIINTNLVGTANMCHCVASYMIKQGGGRIINVTSRGAFRGEPNNPAYGASKAGLNALSQSLAQHLAPHNIFVTAVAPGFVETERVQAVLNSTDARQQSPLGRVARPQEVAYTILFLASAGAEFLTGGIVDINGASYLR